MIVGTVGYMVIEDFSLLEALYQTVVTLSTVGFGEVRPFSDAGRAFSVVLIISSLGTFAYGFTHLSQIMLDGSLQSYFKFVRVKSTIDKLEGHIIVCGLGRNGKQAVDKLRAYKQPFVVVERDEEGLSAYQALHPELLFVIGDATDDEVLKAAGITKATSLISALHNDADNLFVVVSARQLNHKR